MLVKLVCSLSQIIVLFFCFFISSQVIVKAFLIGLIVGPITSF
jgi:hypothetical protein